jgi:ferredoxin
MESSGQRIRANAWGRYYVASDCDACELCVSMAPENFARSADGAYCAVLAQPADEDEERAVRYAMDACPRQCIFDEGDE